MIVVYRAVDRKHFRHLECGLRGFSRKRVSDLSARRQIGGLCGCHTRDTALFKGSFKEIYLRGLARAVNALKYYKFCFIIHKNRLRDTFELKIIYPSIR